MELHILVGPPGAGKSTLAKKLAKQYNLVTLSTDEIREKQFGDVKSQVHNMEVFDIVEERLIDCIRTEQSVIIDCCNLRIVNRMQWLSVADYANFESDRKITKVCHYLKTDLDACLDRNKGRDKQCPEDVVKTFYNGLEKPTISEGWDMIFVHKQ